LSEVISGDTRLAGAMRSGWPELALSWRHQLPVFGALGFRAIAPDEPGEAWAQAHAAFHESLVAACDSRWLLAMREQLY